MPSKKYTTPIRTGRYFHLFNRGINHQTVFTCEEDKQVFLDKVKHYLHDYAEILSYCILDNHYHFLIRIKESGPHSSCFSKQFGKLILSYTYYFNKKYDHQGPIFHRRFKRLEVETDSYLMNLFWYIHANPMHHGLANDYRDYPYSSVNAYLNGISDNYVSIAEGIAHFGTIEKLRQYHFARHDISTLRFLAME